MSLRHIHGKRAAAANEGKQPTRFAWIWHDSDADPYKATAEQLEVRRYVGTNPGQGYRIFGFQYCREHLLPSEMQILGNDWKMNSGAHVQTERVGTGDSNHDSSNSAREAQEQRKRTRDPNWDQLQQEDDNRAGAEDDDGHSGNRRQRRQRQQATAGGRGNGMDATYISDEDREAEATESERNAWIRREYEVVRTVEEMQGEQGPREYWEYAHRLFGTDAATATAHLLAIGKDGDGKWEEQRIPWTVPGKGHPNNQAPCKGCGNPKKAHKWCPICQASEPEQIARAKRIPQLTSRFIWRPDGHPPTPAHGRPEEQIGDPIDYQENLD